MAAVCTADAPPPFLPVFHPPIELASSRPHDCSDLDWWFDCSPISLGKLLQLVKNAEGFILDDAYGPLHTGEIERAKK